MPGGKVEEGEDPVATAVREVKEELGEELGVNVEIVRALGNAEFRFEDTLCQYEWFLAKIVAGEVCVGEPDKFDELRYVSLREMKDLELSANMKNLYDKLKS